MTDAGNFEDKNILKIPEKATSFAKEHGLALERLIGVIQRGKEALRRERERRVHPLLDDKVLASWNGLMLRSFAEAAVTLDRPDYLQAAAKNADFLLAAMKPQGRLLRTYREGQAKLLGYLEDYAFVADGLLALYEATFDRHWLEESISLADSMVELFWDEETGGFYDTGVDHEALVVRPRDVFGQCPALRRVGRLRRAAAAGGNHRQRRLRHKRGHSPAGPPRPHGAGAGGHRTLAGHSGLLCVSA